MAHPWERYIGCLSWVQSRINVLHHYKTFTTDSPWNIRKGDIWDIPCEFKFRLMDCITTRPWQKTPRDSSVRTIPGCALWVQIQINALYHYRVLTTETQWFIRKGDTWDVPCEFKVGIMNCITTGPSQQTPHGSSVRAIQVVSLVSSKSE